MKDKVFIRLVEKGCTKKHGYTLEKANRIVDYYSKQKELRYFYRCPLCGRHHITSKPPMKNLTISLIRFMIENGLEPK